MASGTCSKRATRIVPILVLCVVFLIVASGCGRATPAAPAPKPAEKSVGFPLTTEDSMGRKVTIPSKPLRIVSLVPSNTEILFAVGAGAAVIGVTKYCDYPLDAKKIENVGGFSNPSVEKIVSLKPDLVLAGDPHKTVVEQLEKLNIPTVAVSAKRLADIASTITLIGNATGNAQKAAEVRASIEKRMEVVAKGVASIPDKDKPSVYYELWHEPLTTVGPGSYLHDLIVMAGGVNIAADAKSAYPVLGAETIILRNPQVILYAHAKQRAEELKKRPGWANLSAVKSNRIVMFEDENIFMRAGPRIADAMEILARTLHPGVFK